VFITTSPVLDPSHIAEPAVSAVLDKNKNYDSCTAQCYALNLRFGYYLLCLAENCFDHVH